MNFNKFWIRRRWMDGRNGHGVYLMFALTFLNFILITYRYLIEGETGFSALVENLWFFAIIFIISYIPISIVIGYWHRKTQLSVENVLKRMEDPLFAKMIRTLLDVQTKKASEEEINEFRDMLESIEKK